VITIHKNGRRYEFQLINAHRLGQHIFNDCILTYLAGKTRILVTHYLHLLPKCDHVIVLENGEIKGQGSYEQLEEQGIELKRYTFDDDEKDKDDETASQISAAELQNELQSVIDELLVDEAHDHNEAKNMDDSDVNGDLSGGDRTVEDDTEVVAHATVATVPSSADTVEIVTEKEAVTYDNKLMTVEYKESGNVSKEVYWYYAMAGGLLLVFLVFLFNISAQLFDILAAFYLANWGDKAGQREDDGRKPFTNRENLKYLNGYALLASMGVVSIVTRSLFQAEHRVRSAAVFHRDLLKRVLGAPIAFFDVTPLGKCL
jgi:ATP-binding cassette subfamily C (CFTR/MRP) protein 1